jgi:hypothetical protein
MNKRNSEQGHLAVQLLRHVVSCDPYSHLTGVVAPPPLTSDASRRNNFSSINEGCFKGVLKLTMALAAEIA